MTRLILAALSLTAVVLAQSGASGPENAGSFYVWRLPKGFPKPRVPSDNPMTAQKVELGRHLFYDTRLSVNGKASCATCHKQELAFTDGRPVAIGTTGEAHPRNAMSLVNVAYAGTLTWSNPGLTRLEDQALTPMYGEHPLELGLRQDDDLLAKLGAEPIYSRLFKQAFSESADPISRQNLVYAIASFERSIISADSPYDRYHYGGDDLIAFLQSLTDTSILHDSRFSNPWPLAK